MGNFKIEHKVSSIEEYIEKISVFKEYKVAFRGENKKYSPYCQPSIYRKVNYKNDKYFEIKLLDKYSTKFGGITKDYLLKAIDLQHGGFPSRLLDISFNALIALHFAVTPHFLEKIESADDEDGYIFILDCEELQSPTSINASELFNCAIKRERTLPIESYSHFMLDHLSINERIKVQNGGFILFIGEEFRSIDYLIKGIIIVNKENKKDIRKSLLSYFGIDNGYVYPESDHLVNKFLEDINHYKNCSFEITKDQIINNTISKQFKFIYASFIKHTNEYLKINMENELEFKKEFDLIEKLRKKDKNSEFNLIKEYSLFLDKERNSIKKKKEFFDLKISEMNRQFSLIIINELNATMEELMEISLDFGLSVRSIIEGKNMRLEDINSLNEFFDYELNSIFNKIMIRVNKYLKISFELDISDIKMGAINVRDN